MIGNMGRIYAKFEKNDPSPFECRSRRSRTISAQGRTAQILLPRLKSFIFSPVYTHTFEHGVQAMQRLKSVFLFAIIALTAPAIAQQPGLDDAAAQSGSFAVIGDVERCQVMPVSTGSAMTVRQAAMRAGLLSETVNVTVIRSAQDRAQWTQLISTTSADSGESVENGDVLLVQSMSPLTVPVKKNAALRTDAGVKVVSLEGEGIAIGDVLHQTNNLPLAEQTLKVICRFQGQTPITNADLYHTIAHGDVISISQGGRSVLKGFGDMTPVVSAWKSANTSAAPELSVPNPVPTNETLPPASAPAAEPLQFPTTPAGFECFPEQKAEPPVMLVAGQDAATDNTTTDGTATQDSTVAEPAMTISQSESAADPDIAENRMSIVPDAGAVAPIAPQEMQMGAVTNSASNTFNPWNLVFIGGLMLAGTLILAGTLKPEPDDNTGFSKAAARATDAVASTGRQKKPVASSWLKSTAMADSPAAAEDVAVKLMIPADSMNEAAKSLVSSHEWFSRDWQEFSTDRTGEVQAPAIPAASSGADDRTHIPHSEVAEPAIQNKNDVWDRTSTEGAAVDVSSFPELEDLLQNRLPIDLCETQLPLRVTLFGRPAGPRRLRIDAAHSAIPTPHINTTAGKRREQSVAATVAASSPVQASQSQADAEASSGLDSALHFLQERTEL